MTKIYNTRQLKKTRKDLRKKSTIHEIILWSKLRNKQLGYKFIVDFCCVDMKLIIEIDGSQHLDKQKEYNMKRDKYLKSLGFRIMRFGNDEVNRNIDGVVESILDNINKKE